MDRRRIVVELFPRRRRERPREDVAEGVVRANPLDVRSEPAGLVPLQAAGHREELPDRDRALVRVEIRHERAQVVGHRVVQGLDVPALEGDTGQRRNDTLRDRARVVQRVRASAAEVLLDDEPPVSGDQQAAHAMVGAGAVDSPFHHRGRAADLCNSGGGPGPREIDLDQLVGPGSHGPVCAGCQRNTRGRRDEEGPGTASRQLGVTLEGRHRFGLCYRLVVLVHSWNLNADRCARQSGEHRRREASIGTQRAKSAYGSYLGPRDPAPLAGDPRNRSTGSVPFNQR